jgi:hypothetical protein
LTLRSPISPNVQYYYAFEDTSPSTPGVLIEHGYGAPGQGDHDILYNNIDLIAQADVRAICAFLKIDPPTFTAPTQPPTPPRSPPSSPSPPPATSPSTPRHYASPTGRNTSSKPTSATTPQATASRRRRSPPRGNAPITLMLRWAQDHFTQGETAPCDPRRHLNALAAVLDEIETDNARALRSITHRRTV